MLYALRILLLVVLDVCLSIDLVKSVTKNTLGKVIMVNKFTQNTVRKHNPIPSLDKILLNIR